MARFIRILDTLGETHLVNTDRVVLVDPPHSTDFPGARKSSRLWLDEAMGDVWIDTKLPFDEIAALLNGES